MHIHIYVVVYCKYTVRERERWREESGVMTYVVSQLCPPKHTLSLISLSHTIVQQQNKYSLSLERDSWIKSPSSFIILLEKEKEFDYSFFFFFLVVCFVVCKLSVVPSSSQFTVHNSKLAKSTFIKLFLSVHPISKWDYYNQTLLRRNRNCLTLIS